MDSSIQGGEQHERPGEYVVFCADGEDYGQAGYIFFTHEADVMMIAAAGEVESGKLTPAEARELLEPYREVLPPLYTDSQQAVFDPDRISWRDPDSFPAADDVQQSPQASQIFWYEVDDLGIEGVTLVWSVPFLVLAPVRKKALEELEEAVSDEYEIVVKKDIDEFDAMGKSVEWARKLIEEATTTENPQQSQFFSGVVRFGDTDPEGQEFEDPTFAGEYYTQDYFDESSPELQMQDVVYIHAPYSDREDYLGMEGKVVDVNHPEYVVAFEGLGEDTFPRESLALAYRLRSEYINDSVDQLQVGDKVRICLIEDESQADLVNAIGVVVSTSGSSCTLDVDGATHVFERWAIELMPTNYNPHYIGKQGSELTTQPESSPPERRQSRKQLVYGDGGQEGLVFLEEDYIMELKDFCDALLCGAAT